MHPVVSKYDGLVERGLIPSEHKIYGGPILFKRWGGGGISVDRMYISRYHQSWHWVV